MYDQTKIQIASYFFFFAVFSDDSFLPNKSFAYSNKKLLQMFPNNCICFMQNLQNNDSVQIFIFVKFYLSANYYFIKHFKKALNIIGLGNKYAAII